jgi:hypothetical protein
MQNPRRRRHANVVRLHAAIWLLAGWLGPTTAAFGQTPSFAVPLAQCPVEDPSALSNLTSSYKAGDTDGFEQAAAVVVRALRGCRPDGLEQDDRLLLDTLDLKTDYLALAWSGEDAISGATLYFSIVHRKSGVFSRALPGVTRGGRARLVQVFLGASAADRLAALYQSEPQQHPLAAQLPSFAAAISAPVLAGLAEPHQLVAPFPRADARPGAWANVARVGLPFRRASIRVELRAALAPRPGSIAQQAGALTHRMAFVEVPHVPCARELASQLEAVIAAVASDCPAGLAACLEPVDEQFRSRYEAEAARCAADTPAERRTNLQALQRVDAAYRTYVAEIGTTIVPATFQITNAPRARFSLGVGTAYLSTFAPTSTRATLDHGVLSADPARRQVSMVMVNGAFRSYDSSRPGLTWRERARWFAGTVVSPDPGGAAGISILLARGLAINVGTAVLAVRTPAAGESIGERPHNASAPFRIGAVGGGIAGFSYNFR